jgi:mutator protein MutT
MTETRSRVVAAVIKRDNCLMICQRPAHKRYGGLWEFPGGKLKDGESAAAAVKRELDEELGLAATGFGEVLFSHPDPGSGLQIEFLEVAAEGEPVLREHTDVAWVEPERLLSFPLAPSDTAFAKDLES